MGKKKKWFIKGLDSKSRYAQASRIVLDKKLRDIIKLINIYFQDDNADNLHQLRISIRRFRYVMEIFYDCTNSKLFDYIYVKAKQLQDLIGEGRDLDVLEIKVKGIEEDIKTEIPKYFYKKIDDDRIITTQQIKQELIKFLDDKKVNKFLLKERKGAL